jgi:hypothetical protein
MHGISLRYRNQSVKAEPCIDQLEIGSGERAETCMCFSLFLTRLWYAVV